MGAACAASDNQSKFIAASEFIEANKYIEASKFIEASKSSHCYEVCRNSSTASESIGIAAGAEVRDLVIPKPNGVSGPDRRCGTRESDQALRKRFDEDVVWM